MKTIKLLALVITLTLLSFFTVRSFMQEKPQVVRIAKISVDPARLNEYKAALKEGIETAVRTEPGVLSYHAVSDKLNPANITILEVYANIDAYQSHIETPHFKKYKTTTQNMVVSLDLVDVEVIDFVTKE
jgi:quinol monooxygenase YgiN